MPISIPASPTQKTNPLQAAIQQTTAAAANAASTAVSTAVNAAATTASSVLGKSVSAVASLVPNAVSSVFGATDKLLGSVSSVFQDMTKGVKEVDSKIAQLASDVTGAIAKPVAFITKGLTDVVTGVTTQLSGLLNPSGILGGLGEGLGNLGKVVGSAITSVGALGQALGSVAGSLVKGVTGVASGMLSAVTAVVAPVTSTIGSFASSLVGGVAKTLVSGAGSAISSAVSLVSATAQLGSSVIDILPSPLNSYVKYKAVSALGDAIGINLTAGSSANIQTTLYGYSSSEQLIAALAGLSSKYSYPIFTDAQGNDVSRRYGNGSASTSDIEILYNGANTICPQVNLKAKTNFKLNKDLFDVLALLSASLGLSDLLAQLFGCSGKKSSSAAAKLSASLTSSKNFSKINAYKSRSRMLSSQAVSPTTDESDNTTTDTTEEDPTDPNRINYFDNRTVEALVSVLPSIAYNGDIETYKTIVEIIGPSKIPNAKADMVMLNANLTDEGTNIATYKMLLDALNLTTSDILTYKTLGSHVIADGQLNAAMSATNTNVTDDVYSKEDRILMQGALLTYATAS